MKVKLITFFLAASILFVLAGCGSSTSSEGESSVQSSAATTSEASAQSESEAVPELSAVTEESSSVEAEEAESSYKTYATELYTVGDDLAAGSYLITCTETNYSMEVNVFADESDYETFQDTRGLSVGDYRSAIEACAWADTYLKQDEQFYVLLNEGNIVMLDDGTGSIQAVDISSAETLCSGLYVVGKDISAGEYDATCTSDSLQITRFASKENYLAYHSTSRFTIGEESDALEQYAISSDYASTDGIIHFSLSDGMILMVENGTGELTETSSN